MVTSAGSRPESRSTRVRHAIYTAVGELVGEGAEKISFPVIAERAGVNPTTLYRRWEDVGSLLEEVSVAALTRDGDEPPDTGSIEGDLAQWAGAIAHDISRPARTRYLRAMVAARTEALIECPVNERRRGQAEVMLARARGRGEATPTVAQVLDHVVAPLYYRTVFGLGIADDQPQRLVRDVLAMAGEVQP